ncbi:MAG: TlpA family protein disulfide reductase [Armatimonadetes bacterium]|nr:TlpA family protein disulfide reductase [Armatimonadota bacterium]
MLSVYAGLLITSLQTPNISPLMPAIQGQKQGQIQDQKAQTAALLTVGTDAPDFTVSNWAGGDIKLSSSKGKIVVLTFWSTTVPASSTGLADTEKLAKSTKEQGVDFVQVDTWDDKSSYETYMNANISAYPTLMFGMDPSPKDDMNIAKGQYKVTDLPTTYVIDKDGKVAAAFSGFQQGDTRLQDALQKLGVTIG